MNSNWFEDLFIDEAKAALDANGNGGIIGVEPAEDDIPRVFIEGTIPTTKDEVLAEMKYISKTESFHAYLKIKCQGSSSMNYDKKNFTVKLYSDEARETKLKKNFRGWGNQSKFCLKANYIDHSHARNIICARLWDDVVRSRSDYDDLPEEMRNSPRNGAVDGFPIKVYTNGTYQGIYTWNIPKDSWTWNMDEDNPNHILLCGETNTDGVYAENACNFRALWSGVNEEHWSVEVGTNSDDAKNSLNNLIACVMNTDDETFESTIGTYLDVQSAIDYYIHMYVIAGIDGLAKNLLLATYDGVKWICGAYDMDSTFGLTPQGGTDIVRPNYACPEEYKEQFSLLWVRIVNSFYEDIIARYHELRKSVYSFNNIVSEFEYFMDAIGLDLFAEDANIYSIPSATKNNIQYIRAFVRDRLAYTDVKLPELTGRIAAIGLALDKTSINFEAYRPVTLYATPTPENATDTITWYSSNNDVAYVENAVVTPMSEGTATITVKCGKHVAECNIIIDNDNIPPEALVWKDGYWPAGDTGEVNVGSSGVDVCTEYVHLRGAKHLMVFPTQAGSALYYRAHFYDKDKNHLGYVGGDHAFSTLPDDTVYAIFYVHSSNNISGIEYSTKYTYFTDVNANNFVRADSSKFVANYIPSESGEVAAGNIIGYYNVPIAVSEGQHIFIARSSPWEYTGESNIHSDTAIYGFDESNNFVGKITDYLTTHYYNGFCCSYTIPAGVVSIKIGSHNTTKDYVWYKIS